jgi:hypothetical protein
MTILLLSGILAFSGCLSVDGDRITAKDFAQSIAEFSALPSGVSIGYSPLPGAHRTFLSSDVQRIAAQYGVKTSFKDSICFEWAMRRLDRGDVLHAISATTGEGEIQLEEYSLFPAPVGEIVFPLAGLNRQAQGTSFWRGYVEYGGGKHFNIWAKVRFTSAMPKASKPDVVSGSKVVVTVRSGAAEIKMEAQAISGGVKGQTVTIRNPNSGRSFAAEVIGKDSVFVDAGEAQK